MQAAIYRISTGEILRIITCSPLTVSDQVQNGEESYLNCPADATHIINGEPVVVAPPPPPPPTPEELRTAAKIARAKAVSEIIVTVSTGKTFDGDEDSQGRMARAMLGMQAINRPTITWTLADNSIVDVTVAELTEALCLAGERQAELWPIEL